MTETAAHVADGSTEDPRAVQAEIRSTRERILQAAELRFAESGYTGAAMRGIAASVDLQAASLYTHFPSKQALYQAVLERGLQPIRDLLDSLATGDWTPSRFDAETDRLIENLARQPHVARLIMLDQLAGGEHLGRLAQDWLRPLYDRARSTLQGAPAMKTWPTEELPLLLMTFQHLFLGYFAMASVFEELTGEDPMTPDGIAAQRRFMRKMVRLLLVGEPGDEANAAGALAEGEGEVKRGDK